MDKESDRIAKGFMALGVQKDDKIAIWATNVPEWFLTLFASAKIGAVLVTVNTNYKVFEAEYLLSQSDTRVLVMIDGFKGNSYVDTIYTLVPELKDSKDGSVNSKRLPFLKNVVFA